MKFTYTLLLILISLFSSAQSFIPNTIIIKIKPEYKIYSSTNTIQIKSLQEEFKLLQVETIEQKFPFAKNVKPDCKNCTDLSLIYEIQFKSSLDIQKIIRKLSSLPEIEYVDLKPVPQLLEVPTDPLNITNQYYLDNIQAYDAYDLSKGDSNIIIGILDTGFDFYHEDLTGSIAYNSNDSLNGFDDDNDGFIDNFRGWDLGENDNNPQVTTNPSASSPYHGIHVAGVAGAKTNNNIGITGVGYNCKILPIKISNDNGTLTHSYEGVVYAAEHGCQIINCSWGNTSLNLYAEDVVKYATFNKGALIIAAGGNDGNEGLFYPASFDYVISVAATDINDVKWANSNYNNRISISAPGSSIYFTMINNQYGYGWGTSFASPVVAGCVGITKAYYQDYTMIQIGELLKNSTDIIDTITFNQSFAGKMGTGRVNIYKALTQPAKPSIIKELISIESDNQYLIPGTIVDLKYSFTNYLSMVSNTSIYLADDSEYIEYTNSEFFVDTLKALETKETETPYSFSILDDIPYNQNIEFNLYSNENIAISNPYYNFVFNRTYLDIHSPTLNTTITSNGKIGYLDYKENIGDGFVYKDMNNFLYQCGIMAGNSTYKVVSAVMGSEDFTPLTRPGIIDTVQNNVKFNSKYEDISDLENSLGITINQNTYLHTNEDSSNFIITEYQVINTNQETIEDFYFSIFADWDISNAEYNKADYSDDENLIYTYSATDQNYYAGIQLISNQEVHYYNIDNIEGGNGGIDVTNGFSLEEKFFVMSNNRYLAGEENFGNDVINVISAGPFNILPDDTATIVFSLIAADNYYILKNSAQMARNIYQNIYTSILTNLTDCTFEIFPNIIHSSSYISIRSEIHLYEIELYNNEMKLVSNNSAIGISKESNLYIPKVGSGIYYVKVKFENGQSKVRKIIVL
jgi:serine protease